MSDDNFTPESVKAAGKQADELIKSLNTSDETQGTEDQDRTAEGDKTAEHGGDTTQQQAPPAPPKTDEVESWKQKYAVLQGKYNAEIPRLTAKVNELSQEIARLTAKLSKKAGDIESDDRTADMDNGDDLDPEAFEEYGKPFVNLAKKNKELQSKLSEIENDKAADAAVRFRQDMAVMFPEWDTIDKDPGFINWLKNDIHPTFGESRYSRFAEAVNRWDAPRVAGFFQEYVDLHPKTDKTPSPSPKPTPKNIQPQRRAESHSQAVDGKKIWTQRQIKEFYKDKATGLYRGKEQEANEIEKDILAAPGEGRISRSE